MSDHTKRTHFRGKPRLHRSLALRFRARDADEASAIEALTDNIGIGGAFIDYPTPWPIGTELSLALELPSSPDPVTVAAAVRWIVPQGGGRDEVPGMGVEFVDPDIEAVMALKAYFASLTGVDE